METQPRTRYRPAARPRPSRAHALAIVAIGSAILLWGAVWIALGVALIQEAGA
jgi:hypothetical protein